MLTRLTPFQSNPAAPLFAGLEHHQVLDSIFAGLTPAGIYVDDPHQPAAGFTCFKHRAFLGGVPIPGFVAELRQFLGDDIIPASLAHGVDVLLFHWDYPGWEAALTGLTPGLETVRAKRLYFAFNLEGVAEPAAGSHPGFDALDVDAALLARDDLEHIAELRDEACSERLSVEDFTAHSFGVCLAHGNELAAWCLSEYNHGGCCEVGVATRENHQRRGLGTAVTRRLLQAAHRHGYQRVGWHCWSNNQPSAALARRAGFKLVCEYPVQVVFLKPS